MGKGDNVDNFKKMFCAYIGHFLKIKKHVIFGLKHPFELVKHATYSLFGLAKSHLF